MEYVLLGIGIFVILNLIVTLCFIRYGLTKYTYDERFRK